MTVLYNFNLIIFLNIILALVNFFLGIKFILLLVLLIKGLFYPIIIILVVFTIILVLLLIRAKEGFSKIFIIIISSL